MAITRSTPFAIQGGYASNGPYVFTNINVPTGALCVVFCFSTIRSTGAVSDPLHNMTVSDTGNHTWTLRAVESQAASNAGMNAVWVYDWFNATGATVTLTTTSSSSDLPYNPSVSTVAQVLTGVKDPSTYTPQIVSGNTLASPQLTMQPSYSGSQIIAGISLQNPTATITAVSGSTIDTSPAALAMNPSLLSGVIARSTPETSIASPVTIGANATSDSGYTLVGVEYLAFGTNIVTADIIAEEPTVPVTANTTLTATTKSTGTGRTYAWSIVSGGGTLSATSGQAVSLTAAASAGTVTIRCLISDSLTNSTVSTSVSVIENHYRVRASGGWSNPIYNNRESGSWVSNVHYGVSRGMSGVFSTDNRTYTSVIQSDTPSVYYAMQEAGGTAAIDWSGNAQHGSYQGTIQLNWAMNPYQYAPVALGRQIQMVPYASSNPYIQMPANSVDVTNGFSFEAWVYAGDYSWGYNSRLFSASTASTDQIFFGHDYDAASYSFSVDGQTLLSVPAPANDLNVWHHFVVTAPTGGGTGSVYIDGALAGTGSVGTLTTGDYAYMSVGTNTASDSTYSGLITQVAFYGFPLTSSRVLAHYTAGYVDADPVWYGPAEFYDPTYYNQFTNAGSVLGAGSVVPIADFMPNGSSSDILADANYINIAATPNATDYGDWRAAGVAVLATNPTATPATGAMVGTPGSETIGYFVSDEADMDGSDGYTYMTQCSAVVPSGYLQYANFGNFVTMGMGSSEETPGVFTNYAPLNLQSCDIYFYATDLSGTTIQDYWGIANDQVRRACNYGRATQHARSFFDRVQPQLGFVELAHPYNPSDQLSGGPNPDQVEGAVWSHIIGGARGIIYFHHNFATVDSNGDPITPQVWDSTASYTPGANVNYTDPGTGVNTWYYAALQPSVGEAPFLESYTWVRWDEASGAGISINDGRHPDLPARMEKIKADFMLMAPAIYSPTTPHLCHKDIYSTYRPNATDGKKYIIALPDMGAPNGGTFDMYLPTGQSPSTITVVGENRSITPSGGMFSDTFASEADHHIYRW